MRHRILGLWTIFIGLTAVLLGRLFIVAIHPLDARLRWQDRLPVRATMEHLDGQVIDDARGRVLFRDGEPLTGEVKHAKLEGKCGSIPYSIHTERTSDASLDNRPGMAVAGQVGLPDVWPSNDMVVAEQGRSGLEASFDKLLTGKRPGYIGVLARADGRLEPGQVLQVAPKPGPDVRTTLDLAWQDTAERALKVAGIPLGAVVVLDTRTNQALAVANQSPLGPWDLPAVRPAVPGSVMKLVTAATAFESYRYEPESKFYCDGISHLDGVRMHCWTSHGQETLTQAIARSCDVALAVVGARVHRGALQAVWDDLGLSTPNLQQTQSGPVLREAKSGVLFRRQGDDNGLLANTAIGQEDVQISPLQAANLASTIANRGLYRDVQLVEDAELHHEPLRRFDISSGHRSVSPFTAEKLAVAMREAVVDPLGTAHYLDSLHIWVAAKTGTAQLPDGRVNAWLVGFAPVDQSQIAFAIYAGDLPEARAHLAVRQMAQTLLKAYRQFPSNPVIG